MFRFWNQSTMTTSKTFCFIPAKSFSQRLPSKNMAKINGKELISYPIQAAIESGLFHPDDIILSTDSKDIRHCAETYGAKVPYLRDTKLARDPYGIADVILDFLNLFPQYHSYDSFCIMLPTAPLTVSSDIVRSHEIYRQGNFNALMSVCETEHNAQRSLFVRDDRIVPIFPENMKKKSQELEATYRINGSVSWIRTREFREKKTYFLDPFGAYIMPPERSIDIDTEFNLRLATLLMQSK